MPGLLLPQNEPASLKPGLRHALSGITNEAHAIDVPPPSPPRTTVIAPPPISAQTIRDIQLVFDPSPGAFVHIKKLGPDFIIARELDYHWCRGKSSARLMCFKIFRKAERTRQSVVNELLAYKNLVKKDFVGTAFILRLDGILEDRERVFLAFNFVQRSLADVLVGPRSNITQYKVQWVAQIILGLSAIHTCGIIHRDLKPSNVLLDDHNNIRIAGFDVAFIKSTGGRRNTDPVEHLSSSSSSSPSPTLKPYGSSRSKQTAETPTTYPPGALASDEVRGTWPYMAPEVLANALKRFKIDKRMYTKAVDYWSLGCLVYTLETGEALFGNFGDITLYGRCKDNEKYHRFEGLNDRAESMIYGLTRPDVAKRFGDANLRKHAYFKDENGESEFKKWSKYRPPVPKSRPEAHMHVEPDDDVLLRKDPIVYRPCLKYADSVPGVSLDKSPLSHNAPSCDNGISKSSRENGSLSKVSESIPRPSEGLITSEDEWILGEHCWINPRGIWSTSAGRGMPEKNLVLYETRP